ncbi:DUF2975 domain-containing protein [Parasphingopyxis sp.]|uniref:DUF2975 domain-containing protein n=1 Tax=Parasphingopyxis sp. TaxID=1920299 RepID=UPI00261607AE|nr:DUF2975 domain-containing protein [Parasphingopyxis sp.]
MYESENAHGENDAVLKIARALIIIAQWGLILASAALVIMIPCLFIFSGPILGAVGDLLVEQPDMPAIFMMAALLVMCLVVAGLTYFAFNRLRRIVESVRQGDPFIPINGVRLRGMGLAVLAIQLFGFAATMIATALVALLGEWKPSADVNLGMESGISLSGILLGLLLIVLARVFDRGAAMREDLEGTV